MPEPSIQATLEEKIAHLERLTSELSDVIARQDGEVATLRRQVTLLLKREAEREAQGGGGAVFGDEKPPHY
ncbi:MAG: SlyX family protein [Pseudomonadota bacterium]